jgi:hypothetical protein
MTTQTFWRVMMFHGLQYSTLYVLARNSKEAMAVANEAGKTWVAPAVAKSAEPSRRAAT